MISTKGRYALRLKESVDFQFRREYTRCSSLQVRMKSSGSLYVRAKALISWSFSIWSRGRSLHANRLYTFHSLFKSLAERTETGSNRSAMRIAILFINTFPFTTKRRTTQNVTRILLSNHDFTSMVTNGNAKSTMPGSMQRFS